MRLLSFALAMLTLLAPKGPAAAAPLRTLTSIGEVRRLTRDQAARGFPVSVRGQITFSAPDNYLTLLQDSKDAIYLFLVPRSKPTLQPGDIVQLAGTSGKGLFSPLINVETIRVLGHAPLPEPRRLKHGDLGTGRLDCWYSEMEGVLRSYHKSRSDEPGGDGALRLFLDTDFGRITVVVLDPRDTDVAPLVGSRIRARGDFGIQANQRGQLIDEYLLTASGKDLQVIAPESVDPARERALNTWELMQFHNSGEALSRVRIQGKLTLIKAHRYVILQQGDRGVNVEFDQRETFPIGATLEATGFPAMGGYSPVLKDSVVRLIAPGAPVQPVEIDAASALRGEHNLELVRMKAEVVAYVHDRDRQVVWLRSGQTTFATILDEPEPPNALDNLKNGSVIDVTAVCNNLVSEQPKELIGFRLLLRSPQDVRVVSLPRRWLGKQVMEALGVTLIPILLVLIWNTALRRRVKLQTAIIEKRADFDRECAQVLEMVGRDEGIAAILKKIRHLLERQFPGCCCLLQRIEDGADTCDIKAAWHWSTSILSSRGETLGTCSLHFRGTGQLAAHDRHLLEGVMGIAAIAMEHRRLCDRLITQSRQDGLTGLANRVELEERFTLALAQGKRYRHRVACLYIDLDGFKQVNDRFGHAAGDCALQSAGLRIQSLLRAGDTLARIGGDEFCIVIPEAELDRTAEYVAEKLIAELEQPLLMEGEVVHLSASVGISYFPTHADSVIELQRRADLAMYRAKRAGKGRFRVFNEEDDEGSTDESDSIPTVAAVNRH